MSPGAAPPASPDRIAWCQRARGLLGLAPAKSPAPPAAEPTAAPPKRGVVAFAKCRLAWEATRKKVHVELQKLERAILAEYAAAPFRSELQARVRKLDLVLAGFADNLRDTLDAAANATDEAARQAHRSRAAEIVDRYRAHVDGDPLLQEIETNPFVPVKARALLLQTLSVLAAQLAR
ncbi:MAG: hypothetical protein KDC98_22450 [Planctomycetes bacterium]|nr:hypothetical protein [Planctomycetota bacterium]